MCAAGSKAVLSFRGYVLPLERCYGIAFVRAQLIKHEALVGIAGLDAVGGAEEFPDGRDDLAVVDAIQRIAAGNP